MNEIVDHHLLPVDEYATVLAGKQELFVGPTTETNHGIHEVRLGDRANYPNHQDAPYSLYFYYVRIDTNGKIYVTHHFFPGGDPNDQNNPGNPHPWTPIPRDEQGLKALLQTLALDARAGGVRYPVIGRDFVDIKWRRKSCIALFIDEVNWKLHKLANGDPCIVFITEPKDGATGTANHSFFDASDLDVDMPINGGPAVDQRTAVVFVNHMKADEAGNDLGGGPGQFFQFKIFFDVAFASGASGITVIFDPGGTNLGPPVPPP